MQVIECVLLFLDVAPTLLDARRRVTLAVGRFSRFKTIVGERRCFSGYRKVDAEASLALDRWSIFEHPFVSLRRPWPLDPKRVNDGEGVQRSTSDRSMDRYGINGARFCRGRF